MTEKRRLLVVAGGTKTGGGSGFENLVERQGAYDYEVVGVTSHIWGGGVHARAERLKIPFFCIDAPYSAEQYQRAMADVGAEFYASSGCVKPIRGLAPNRGVNIHPALPPFIGQGMWGHHVHEAVIAAYARDEIRESGFFMHYVTEEYDQGPEIFRYILPIRPEDTAETLGAFVNGWEHEWQPAITHAVVRGDISWSGVAGEPVTFPPWYQRVERYH